jgi:hypothetical protein
MASAKLEACGEPIRTDGEIRYNLKAGTARDISTPRSLAAKNAKEGFNPEALALITSNGSNDLIDSEFASSTKAALKKSDVKWSKGRCGDASV